MSETQPRCNYTQFCGERMEDVPVCRYSTPIPLCSGNCAREHWRSEQLLQALNGQNQLLVDILGALNGLTAVILAGHTQQHNPAHPL